MNIKDETQLVLIPGLEYWNISNFQSNYLLNEVSPYYFYDFFLVNEEYFLKDNYLEGTAFYYG